MMIDRIHDSDLPLHDEKPDLGREPGRVVASSGVVTIPPALARARAHGFVSERAPVRRPIVGRMPKRADTGAGWRR